MNLEYLDYPALPKDLLTEIYKSLEGIDRFPYKNDQYKSFEATPPLVEFTQSIFDFDHNTAVQIIRDHLIIHKDAFRTKAFNYLIEPGGDDVQTCFYDEDLNLTDSYQIECHRWHRLDVSVNHNVINLVKPRIAITVHDKREIPIEYQW